MARAYQTPTTLDEAKASLSRIQGFDATSLIREEEFGRVNNFRDAVEPAEALIDLYKRVMPIALDDFPDTQLTVIRNAANRDYALFERILKLDPNQGMNAQARASHIDAIRNAYAPTFAELYTLIAFSLHRAADFAQLDRDGRAAVQALKDRGDVIEIEFKKLKGDAQTILEIARKAAAEHGVAQQAAYFRDAANDHETQAKKWRIGTIWLSVGLGLYAALTLFIHKWSFLRPTTTYETVQLAISKVLIFTVISYMLYLAARNFLAHKHNAIVNKHRQTALQTYEALAAAAKETSNREIILTHASACIFTPQPTGYGTGGESDGVTAKSVVEVFGKVMDR